MFMANFYARDLMNAHPCVTARRVSESLFRSGELARTSVDHLKNVLARRRIVLANRGERPIDREVLAADDEQFFPREPRDHFVAGFGDDDLLFDARRAP